MLKKSPESKCQRRRNKILRYEIKPGFKRRRFCVVKNRFCIVRWVWIPKNLKKKLKKTYRLDKIKNEIFVKRDMNICRNTEYFSF